MKLIEPEWWIRLMNFLNDFQEKNYIVSKYVPITADIFVFFYPFYLVFLYLYWVFKKDVNFKYASLYIFFSSFNSFIFNQFFQIAIHKERPWEHVASKKDLILDGLPDMSFPSDHMVLSMTIATSTLLWWVANKKRSFVIFSIILFTFSFTMWISRVMYWIHWPTDIIAGFFLGIIRALIMIHPKVFWFFRRFVYDPIIRFQKLLFSKFLWIKED